MSYQISEAAPHEVTLGAAILLYGAKSEHSSGLRPDFATVHPVERDGDGAARIGPGRPVDKRAVLDMAMGLAGRARIRHGLLPATVLSLGMDYVLWWIPPACRTVFFDAKGEGEVGKRAGKTPHPGLVFLARERRLYAFAVKGRERPEAGAALHHAPYFNVWRSGEVCTGSTPLPEDSIVATMKAWEDGFFGSNFSHTNHERSVKYPGGAHAFWTDMLDGRHRTFPASALVRRGKETLGGLIEQIEGGAVDE